MNLDAQELEQELEEKHKDLQAFLEAREIIRRRVQDVADGSKSNLTPLHNWAGTDCVLGGLDLTIHSMERTIEELNQLLKATRHGRVFRVVDGGSDGK